MPNFVSFVKTEPNFMAYLRSGTNWEDRLYRDNCTELVPTECYLLLKMAPELTFSVIDRKLIRHDAEAAFTGSHIMNTDNQAPWLIRADAEVSVFSID